MERLTDAYNISSTLFENSTTIIYRATRQLDGKKVILKTHKQHEDVRKIKHEYDLLNALTIDGISNVIDIFSNDIDPTFLVSEDLGAEVLENYIHNRDIAEDEFLQITLNATLALKSIHENKILHRDIKPANMLIDPETKAIWYIDLGISVPVKREMPLWQESVEGTLEYLPPEQTGRVNKPIDYRSDIYSLGVTLYRLLTGRLPFQGRNAMELIHAHIATTPVPPHELVQTQSIISRGVMKMLEKRPEDRYQSTQSLLYDVERCQQLLAADEDCNAFLLAEKDIFYPLEPGHTQYGKEGALDTVKALHDNIDDNRADVVLMDGEASVGKTMILNALEEYISRSNSLLFRGDFDQGERAEPYYALREAFLHFDSLIYGSRISLSSYRESLLESLGENAQALIDILPQMQGVLGRQPPIPMLGPVENQRRSEQVFRLFMQVICDVPCPCVFLFDNVQWADEASLNLLLSAFDDRNLANCMLVLSFRDDDFVTSDRLTRHIKQHNLGRARIHTLHIQPLTLQDTADIILDVLPQKTPDAIELAQYVHEYSGGNIRRVEIYLKDLYHSQAFTFDRETGLWDWDRDAIDASSFQDLREEAQSLLLRMPTQSLYCVEMLACYALEIHREHLDIIFGGEISVASAVRAMRPLIERGLYSYNERNSTFAFDSPRVQKTFYAMLPEAKRMQNHFMIAKRIFEHYQDNDAALLENCSLITTHALRADNSFFNAMDRQRLLALNRQAGDNAMNTSNMEKAVRFYESATRMLGDDPLAQRYDEAFSLFLNTASCHFTLGHIQEATTLYRQAIHAARDEDDLYTAYRELIEQHLSIADWIHVQAYAVEFMSGTSMLLDEDGDAIAQLEAERARYTENEATLGLEYFLRAPMSENTRVRHYGSMLGLLAEAAIVNINRNASFFIYKALNYAYENGLFPDFERALALLAERTANAGDFPRAKNIFDCGIAVAEKHGMPKSLLWAVYGAVILHWVEPLDRIPEVYQTAKHIAMLEGNLYHGSFYDVMLLGYYLFTGANLSRVSKDVDSAIFNATKAHFERFHLVFSTGFRQFIRCMTGRTLRMDSFDDRSFNEEALRAETDPIRWQYNAQFYYAYRVKALFINGYYEQAVRYAQELLKLANGGENHSTFISRVDFCFCYVLAMIRLCEGNPSLMQTYNVEINAALDQLHAYAEANPGNFGTHYRFAMLQRRRLYGFDISMLSELSQIESDFRATNCLWNCAVLEESLMEYWMDANIRQYRDNHSRNAYALYKELGAKLKMMQFMMESEDTPPVDSPTISSTTVFNSTGMSATSDTTYSAALDYQAILNVLSCLVTEQKTEDLMHELLRLLMENAGADQALLFMRDEEDLLLRAFRYSDRHTQGLITQDMPLPLQSIAEDVVPRKVIGLAATKRLQIAANSADNEYLFLADPYLEAHRPESFICLPVIARGKVIGVVYLENAHLPGVFPPQRVSFLNTIVLQASLLLQNALNVQSLEGYTVDLEKRLSSYIGQLNTLIAGIAHEINSPLGVCVTVATRLLERTGEVTASFNEKKLSRSSFEEYLGENSDGLNILTNNISRASDLVQNFKKISVNQSTEVFETLDLMPTLRDISEYIRPAVKKVIESCRINGPDSIMFYTSTGVLAQIFTNLIMNSAIHGFAGMEKTDCHITIDVSDDEDFVHIVYTDNGRGMTPEEKDKVFIPFYTTRRSEGGSGLGGHIIMTLVAQTLKGSIHCITAPGRGTSFVMKLPKNGLSPKEDEHNAP